jgi:Zn-dependent protease
MSTALAPSIGAVDDRPAAAGDAAPSTGNGIRLGRLFGGPIYATPAWFLVAALVTVSYAPGVEARIPGIGPWKFVVSASFALLFYASVLVHELAHTVAALRGGLPVRRISLQLLGGVSEIEQPSRGPRQEAWIAGLGPLTSLALSAVAYLVARPLAHDSVGRLLADALAVSNLLVGAFNLLPGLPLDGGRVLSAAVWRLTGRRETGIVAAAQAGRVVAVLAVFTPAAVTLARGQVADLIDLVWGAMLGSFIWAGAGQALRAAALQQRIPGLSARALTRRAIPVTTSTPLAEALRQAELAGASHLVVVDGDGRPIALVHETAALATPVERRPWVPVGDVSRRLHPDRVLSAALTGEDLVAAIVGSPASEYLVVEPNGEIFGVLVTADVERAVATAP